MADIGSTFTKGMVIFPDSVEILCSGQVRTTSESDVGIGLRRIKDELLSRAGAGKFSLCLAASSARGGLKVAALGLMPELTVKAAKAACLNAGARLLSCYSHRIGSREIRKIEKSEPDVILLAGGTDGGDKTCVVHNARMLSGVSGDPVIMFAGNREAADEVCLLLRGKEVFTAENVLPELDILNIEPAREKLREIFLSRIIFAKGLERAAEQLDGAIVPTPLAVMNAVALLSEGISGRAGWGDFMAVDAGGATTDVYSAAPGRPSGRSTIIKGIPEPYLKRTVEGDIGLRISLEGLIFLRGGATAGKQPLMDAWGEKVMADYSCLPRTEEELLCDAALAGHAARVAVERHSGTLYERYAPEGRVFIQEGKDLRNIKRIAASGGVFANNPFAACELERALKQKSADVLTPFSAEVIPDKSYVLYAAGLFSSFDREAAFLTMEKSFQKNETAQ